jgi:hypothetical protein
VDRILAKTRGDAGGKTMNGETAERLDKLQRQVVEMRGYL